MSGRRTEDPTIAQLVEGHMVSPQLKSRWGAIIGQGSGLAAGHLMTALQSNLSIRITSVVGI